MYYQHKVDVYMLNAIKRVLADVSSSWLTFLAIALHQSKIFQLSIPVINDYYTHHFTRQNNPGENLFNRIFKDLWKIFKDL